MVYAVNPGDFSFGTPVLWLNSDNGTIFSFSPTPGEGETGTVESTQLSAQPPSLDMDAESQWIDTMIATIDVEHLPTDFYVLRSKWINLVNELRSLLYQLAALVEQPDHAIYVEKVTDYRRYKAMLLRVKRLIEDANHKA